MKFPGAEAGARARTAAIGPSAIAHGGRRP